MHTTSLEVSKRLKEAGFEGESQAAWYVEGYAPFWVEKREDYLYLSQSLIPAYTLGELIRELPNHHLRSPKFPNGLFSVTNWATRFVKQATTPEDAAGGSPDSSFKKRKNHMNKDRMYQIVVITFDDGSTATFTGKAVVYPGDNRRTVNIQFSEPEELPEDCSFGFLDELKKGS